MTVMIIIVTVMTVMAVLVIVIPVLVIPPKTKSERDFVLCFERKHYSFIEFTIQFELHLLLQLQIQLQCPRSGINCF